MKKIIFLLILLTSAWVSAFAADYTPEMMPNVNVANRYEYVSDPGNLLSQETKERVNSRLWNLRQKTTCEAMVAIPPSIGDVPIEEWSESLFTLWGIGKKDKDNGVLLVIAPEQHRARIQTGYGMEGVLPDISCAEIIGREIVPNMRENDLDAAVSGAVGLMADAIENPEVAEELRSDNADNYSGNIATLSKEAVWEYIMIIAGCVFLFSLALFCYDLYHSRKSDNYHKAIMWRSHLTTFGWCALFSLGSGLIFYLLALFLYRSFRTRPRKCSTCGTRMKRLSEQDDNELLSASQDFEEKLDTIDYDVWECPKCGTVERYAFRKKQAKYEECPACHTVAMRLIGTKTLRPATYRSAGVGEKIYECEFCHHQKRSQFVIPRKESAAPLIAGAALGSMSGRGGGGGFGGGFGGGATGGGGASGGW